MKELKFIYMFQLIHDIDLLANVIDIFTRGSQMKWWTPGKEKPTIHYVLFDCPSYSVLHINIIACL